MGAHSLLSTWPGYKADGQQEKGNCCSQFAKCSHHGAWSCVQAYVADRSSRDGVGPLEQLGQGSYTLGV